MAFRVALFTILLMGTSWRVASATEVLYYPMSSREAPEPERMQLKDLDGEAVFLAKEPVAKVSSDKVREARIVREDVEVLDDEEPMNAVYRVNLVLEEGEQAKIARTMEGLCKNRAGLAVVVDGVVLGYAPLTVCDRFDVALGFTEMAAAEKFAHQLSKQVSVVTPKPD